MDKRSQRFGSALQAVRAALRLSQDAFGARIGVSRRTLTRWEIYGEWPPVAQRKHIATSFLDAPPHLRASLLDALELGKDFAAATLAPAQPSVGAPGTLEHALLEMAEQLDLGPGRVRQALTTFLARAHEAGWSIDAARASLEQASARARKPAASRVTKRRASS